MTTPTAGGRYVRDAKTGKLTRVKEDGAVTETTAEKPDTTKKED